MGETDENHWLNSRCKPDASKGGIYKVYLSIPSELRDHYGKKELKKSTGTRDPKVAKRIQHEITAQWYNDFRAVLGSDNYAQLIEILALENTPYHFRYIDDQPHSLTLSFRPQNADEAQEAIKIINQSIREVKTASENKDAEFFIERGLLRKELTSGIKIDFAAIVELKKLVERDLKAQFSETMLSKGRSSKTLKVNSFNKSLYPRSSEFIEAYFSNRKWENNTSKEKKTSLTRIQECLKIISDPPLDQIIARNGHDIAEELEERGKANSTIKGYITSFSGLLDYIRIYEDGYANSRL